MPNKNVFAIIGSASHRSSNEVLVEYLATLAGARATITIFNALKSIPHFDPELSVANPPPEVIAFRTAIEQADGVIMCAPEYVYSLPSGLKNALEWCVATMVFTEKPVGLITASAQGQKGHEQLQLVMQTLSARFTPETTLLVQGIKGKVNERGEITNEQTRSELRHFFGAFLALMAAEK